MLRIVSNLNYGKGNEKGRTMIKGVLRDLIYKFHAKNIDKIIEIAKEQEIVSFDVFDTVLKRDVVSPTDVFVILEERIKSMGIPVENFASLRIRAENKARQACPDREVTLGDIYHNFPGDDKLWTELAQLELQIEEEILSPYMPIKKVYDDCVASGKRILFISDIYFPKEFVNRLLVQFGFASGTLYISSESGVTKRNGELFCLIREKEELQGKRWLHIGDSISSDCLIPAHMGIKTVLIERTPRNFSYIDKKLWRKRKNYQQLIHFINVRVCRYDDPFERIGYAVLGPLLYGFSKWLDAEIDREESIAFLAREGELLKRAFEIVSERKTSYFYVSRRAARISFIAAAKDWKDIFQYNVHVMHKMYTQAELAVSCGLSEEKSVELLRSKGLKENDLVSGEDNAQRVFAAVWEEIKDNAVRQHELLQVYINQLHLKSRCALVDVGWHGTIQSLLAQSGYTSKGESINWNGYYIGVLKETCIEAYKENKKKGYLFSENKEIKIQETIQYTAPFFEMLFLSTNGTTKGYEKDEYGKVIPILGKPENSEKTKENISRLQNAGIDFVKDMMQSPIRNLQLEPIEVIANYSILARVPSLKTIRLFREFCADDGYTYQLVSSHGFIYYLTHPKQFAQEILKTPSKVWFMKSVVRIPLPYIPLLNLLRKIHKE